MNSIFQSSFENKVRVPGTVYTQELNQRQDKQKCQRKKDTGWIRKRSKEKARVHAGKGKGMKSRERGWEGDR